MPMPYWVKRIKLKSGELVTERELQHDENLFQGPTPVIGDIIAVTCLGQKLSAKVVWGNWSGREYNREKEEIIPLRVEEL